MAYLVGIGVVAGLFSRIVIQRAMENARLQQRLAEDERDRELVLERELLSRLGRDFAASLDRETTTRAIAGGAATMLGDATLVAMIDDAERRLLPVASGGTDEGLAARWQVHVAERRPRIGEGIIGGVAATAGSVDGSREGAVPGDPDGLVALELGWVLAVPILAGGRLLGVLACAGREGSSPSERIRRLAEAIAERAGPALQNAQLWSDLQERMTREQAAQRIKDDFLSIVSHELRTPLTSIQGYSQLLEGRLRTDRDGESKEMAHLRVIRSQVGRMRRLVDDLLDVSRIDRRGGVSIETIDFDLAALVREAVARVKRENREREMALSAPEALGVHADRDRIDQVLSNLLENAVKYSPDGGPIAVTVERRGGEVEVRVADAGLGIPIEHRENVFERFYQADDEAGRRRFGGLGLGLYISRAIIDAHGGRIWAAAERGGRSWIRVRLPDPAGGHAADAGQRRADRRAATVRGAQPRRLMRERLAELAARHGLELVGVTDAGPLPEAREHMEASVAAGRMARMDWMGGDRPRLATDPRALDPAARSVIVVAAPYAGTDRAGWDPRPDSLRQALAPVLGASPATPAGRIARYALGTDYHVALRDRLEALADDLRSEGLPAGEVAYVDDRPLAERALAARAGMGWIGKNANLLTHARAGSWVFLGALAHVGRAAGGRADPHDLRLLHALPLRLPDRRHRGAADDRRATLHQLPDHRASRRAEPVGGGGHRRLDLRLRRLPGGLPGERGCGRCRPPARAAAAADRVAPADGWPGIRAGGGHVGPHPGRASSAAAQRDRRAGQLRRASPDAP